MVSAEAGITRSELSRRVCDWLDWRGANGKPKEVSSRKALLALERHGLVGLPAAHRLPPQVRPAAPAPPWTAPVFAGALADWVRWSWWRSTAASTPPCGSACWSAITRWAVVRCAGRSSAT